jgi:hypothetical protein
MLESYAQETHANCLSQNLCYSSTHNELIHRIKQNNLIQRLEMTRCREDKSWSLSAEYLIIWEKYNLAPQTTTLSPDGPSNYQNF